MSTTLVARSPDLAQLVAEGYDIEVRDGNLLVHHVPLVTAAGAVDYCILVSELSTNGERTIAPASHTVWVVGGVPHDHQGAKVTIVISEGAQACGDGLSASCMLSGKPKNQSPADYHQKIKNYVEILGRFARAVDSTATHRNYPARATQPDESVFRYQDSATSRSGISAIAAKLKLGKVAIIGLGGTGSYILDLLAKTPIGELHLFDDDLLYAHNAFRAPGAAPLDKLSQSPRKVDYFAAQYDAIRRNIVAHPIRVTAANVEELRLMDFVFLAMDTGPAKREIIEQLIEWGVPFIDSGMNLQRVDDSLRGTLRVTAGEVGAYDHVSQRVSYTDITANEYDANIQTADLNMLNAALAVIKFKKLYDYYMDAIREMNTLYVVARGKISNGNERTDV